MGERTVLLLCFGSGTKIAQERLTDFKAASEISVPAQDSGI